MEVKKIQNVSVGNVPQKQIVGYAQRQSFSGNATAKVGPDAKKLIESLLKDQRVLSAMNSWEWLKGELGGILLTAIGTGAVAPIFIGANPFVKAKPGATQAEIDDVNNTKWYTAIRQPISAGLAILFQLSALKPIDMFMDQIFNNHKYAKHWNSHFDHSTLNTDTYVKRTVSKNMNMTKTPWYKVFSEGFSKVKNQRNAYDEALKAGVKAIKDSQIDKAVDEFMESASIKVGDSKLDSKTMGDLINQQIDSYIKDAEKLNLGTKKVAQYSKRAGILIANEDKLSEMFKDIPVAEVQEKQKQYYQMKYGVVERDAAKMKQLEDELSVLYKNTDAKLKDMYSKETDKSIKEILKEMLERPIDMREDRISRTFARIKSIKEACGEKGFTEAGYRELMTRRNGELINISSQLENLKIADTSKFTAEEVAQKIRDIVRICKFDKDNHFLSTILHDSRTFDIDEEKLIKKVHKDIVKGYKKLIDNEYKFHNQIAKVIIGVFVTLPITCSALNWVYPRFMELFFPKLAGVKKANDEVKNGGNK